MTNSDPDFSSPQPGFGRHVWLAGLLGNAHDAAVAVIACRTSCSRDEFFASRSLGPAGLNALATLQRSLLDLPREMRRELGGIDWSAWAELGKFLPPITESQRDLVWEAMASLLPGVAMGLERLRRCSPELFNPFGRAG